MSNLHIYLNGQHHIDEWSITDIELHISEAPSSTLYRLLLAKKMNNNSENAILLGNKDRVLYHYNMEVNGNIPTLNDLKASLEVNNNEEVPSDNDVKPSHDLTSPEIDVLPKEIFETKDSNEIIEPNNTDALVIEQTQIQQSLDGSIDAVILDKKAKKNKKKKFKLREFSGISDYAIWLISLKGKDITKKIAKEEKAAKKRALEENAKKSVTKSANIISESLAEILANQGHLDDAKKMYELLMQKYPEKSVYFAAKINHLSKI